MGQGYEQYAAARLAGGFAEMNSWQLVSPRLVGKKTLDVGCSDGLYLRALNSGSVGIEQVPDLAAMARTSGHTVLEGSVDSVLPTIECDSFDAILASHVLEHVRRPLDLLAEFARILRPDGLLILGLPIERNIFRNTLRMDYYAGTHIYSFTTRNTRVLLREVGLVPEAQVVYHLPKLHGNFGLATHRAWNAIPHLPGREFFSLAYWMFAHKPNA